MIINIDKAVMHPIMSKFFAVCPLRLGNFVFVMGENKVKTAAVDIYCIAQISASHRRTFNMPARSALAPGRVPIRLARFCAFPKAEIHRIFFYIACFYSRARFQIFQRLMRKLAVIFKFFRPVINIAARFIGIALFKKLRNDFDYFIYIFGGSRVYGRFANVKAGRILPKLFYIAFRNFGNGGVFLIRTADKFIINIGKV